MGFELFSVFKRASVLMKIIEVHGRGGGCTAIPKSWDTEMQINKTLHFQIRCNSLRRVGTICFLFESEVLINQKGKGQK